MGRWLDYNWLESLLFPRSLTVVSFPGCDVLSSESYTWFRVILPTSRFMVLLPLLRIQIASLIFLVNLFESLSSIFAPSQSITWFSWAMWSVIADLLSSEVDSFLWALVNFLFATFSASLWCSFNLVPKALPVSPMYDLSHPLQLMS